MHWGLLRIPLLKGEEQAVAGASREAAAQLRRCAVGRAEAAPRGLTAAASAIVTVTFPRAVSAEHWDRGHSNLSWRSDRELEGVGHEYRCLQ